MPTKERNIPRSVLEEKLAAVRSGTYDHTIDRDEAFDVLCYARKEFTERWDEAWHQHHEETYLKFLIQTVVLIFLGCFIVKLFGGDIFGAEDSLVDHPFLIIFFIAVALPGWVLISKKSKFYTEHGKIGQLPSKYKPFFEAEIVRRERETLVNIACDCVEKR